MATYRITTPQGTYKVTVPEGTSQQQAYGYLQQQLNRMQPSGSAAGRFMDQVGRGLVSDAVTAGRAIEDIPYVGRAAQAIGGTSGAQAVARYADVTPTAQDEAGQWGRSAGQWLPAVLPLPEAGLAGLAARATAGAARALPGGILHHGGSLYNLIWPMIARSTAGRAVAGTGRAAGYGAEKLGEATAVGATADTFGDNNGR